MVAQEIEVSPYRYIPTNYWRQAQDAVLEPGISLYDKFQANTVLIPVDEQAPLPDHGPNQISHEVLSAAIAGDHDAFTQIYAMYGQRILLYCGRRVETRDYEDVAQQTWLKAWKYLGNYQYNDAHFSNWLFTVARGTVVDFHRKTTLLRSNGARVSSLGLPLSEYIEEKTFGDPADIVHKDRVAASIELIVADLPKDQRDVLYWRFQRGYSIAETAGLTNKTENNVKQLTFKGKASMRERLRLHGYVPEDLL